MQFVVQVENFFNNFIRANKRLWGLFGLYGTYWPILPINDHTETCFLGLPSECYVRNCQLGQLPGQAGGGAWKVRIQLIHLKGIFTYNSSSSQDGDVGHPIFSANKYFQQCQVMCSLFSIKHHNIVKDKMLLEAIK